jgi:hypothetical protein
MIYISSIKTKTESNFLGSKLKQYVICFENQKIIRNYDIVYLSYKDSFGGNIIKK